MNNPFEIIYFQSSEKTLATAVCELLSYIQNQDNIISLSFFGKCSDADYNANILDIRFLVSEHFRKSPLVSFIPQSLIEPSVFGLEITRLKTIENGRIEFKQLDDLPYAIVDLSWGKTMLVDGVQATCVQQGYAEQGDSVFAKINAIFKLEKFEIHNIIRQWNYIGRIVDFENGNQHYQLFNNARSKFYNNSTFTNGYPAATGISMSINCLFVSVIAVKPNSNSKILPIDNSLQIPAYKYSESVLVDGKTDHLKTTPKFERAKLLASANDCIIFVSGTAAIRNESSLDADDVVQQTIDTIANINYLISQDNLAKNGWSVPSKSILSSIRVYLKNKNDFETVQSEVINAWPNIHSIYLEAEVCRPELLVEIEGVAEIEIIKTKIMQQSRIFRGILILLFFFSILKAETNNMICSDAVFLRRASIAITGRIPQPENVNSFLASKNTTKRDSLIDDLLNSDAYVHYMCMRWGDILRIKSEFPSNLWPNGVQAYNRWIYERISNNTPYNMFVKELLLSSGSNFRSPAVNFYRAFPTRNASVFYKNINLLFLGNRTPENEGAMFFSQLKFKSTKEWKEEIIYVDYQDAGITQSANLPNKTSVFLSPGTDWREPYVNWLTSKQNKQFAAVMVNRIWAWIMGKGLVNEPDDWRKDNPPSNPELLDKLTSDFINSNFNVKLLIRKLLTSSDFQSSKTFEPKRLLAEVMVDAIADVTGISDSYRSRVPEPFTFYPDGTRSVDLGDATVSSSALELFGRSSRDVSLENQHVTELTDRQILYLLNSSELEQKIRKSPRIKLICDKTQNNTDLCNELLCLTLGRYATENELKLFLSYFENNKMTRNAFATDLVWMCLNSNEFLYQH